MAASSLGIKAVISERALDTLGWKILVGVPSAIAMLGGLLMIAGLGIIASQCYFWLSWGYWSPLGNV